MQRKIAIGIAAFSILGLACDSAEELPEPAANAEAAEKADVDLAELEAGKIAVVSAQRGGDAIARRKACLDAVPKLEAALKSAPDNKKVKAVGTDMLPMCFEILETRKLMAKLAEPKVEVALSAAFASTFTSSDLKKTYKDARRLVKKRQDPTKKCAEVRLLAGHLASKKSRKTKKLLKKAVRFCEGPAQLAAARFHLSSAKKAVAEDKASTLVESCVYGVAALRASPAGKKHDRLSSAADERCLEAVAFQGMLANDAT